MKLGLWLLIAVAAFLWFNHAKKQRLRNRMRNKAPATPASDTDSGPAAGAERILACAHCGLHVPASDALVNPAGTPFCCEAHRRLHSRQ